MQDSDFIKKILSAKGSRRFAWMISFACPLFVGCLFSALRLGEEGSNFTVVGAITILLLIAAAIYDARWLKIPNWLTYPGVVWGLGINFFSQFTSEEIQTSLGAVGLGESVMGLIVPFALMFLLFSITGGGAGDVKLTAALGALLGLGMVLDAILISFVVAGAMAMIRAIWELGLIGCIEYVFRGFGAFLFPLWIVRPSKEINDTLKKPMPLAPSFAIGTLIVMMDQGVLQSGWS